jgi:hypothetical protein
MSAQNSSEPKVPDNRYPEWLPAYKAALLELDPTEMQTRIRVAQDAIQRRMQVLAQDHRDVEEKMAIADALNGLAMLERESKQPRS